MDAHDQSVEKDNVVVVQQWPNGHRLAPRGRPAEPFAPALMVSLAHQAEALARIAACDYRIPIKASGAFGYDTEAGGCGCLAVCLAGFGRKDGAVASECWRCPLLTEPAPPGHSAGPTS